MHSDVVDTKSNDLSRRTNLFYFFFFGLLTIFKFQLTISYLLECDLFYLENIFKKQFFIFLYFFFFQPVGLGRLPFSYRAQQQLNLLSSPFFLTISKRDHIALRDFSFLICQGNSVSRQSPRWRCTYQLSSKLCRTEQINDKGVDIFLVY